MKTARLEDFLNMRNSEGFTSVHLASFAGKQVTQKMEYFFFVIVASLQRE